MLDAPRDGPFGRPGGGDLTRLLSIELRDLPPGGGLNALSVVGSVCRTVSDRNAVDRVLNIRPGKERNSLLPEVPQRPRQFFRSRICKA